MIETDRKAPDIEETIEYSLTLSAPVPIASGEFLQENTFPPSTTVYRTATPQLFNPVNFSSIIKESEPISLMNSSVPINPENIYHDKEDIAEWQYFSPEEFSSESMDALDVVFINKGSTTWTNNYYLSHYAEINPSNRNKLYLDKEITPGETCSIRIPIINNDVSWKSCWELTDDKNTPFFSFCYNHGIGGQNQGKNESLATNNPANSNYSPFTYVENALPSSAVNNSDNAEWVSSNFNDQHAFCAYDHTETWSITLRNAGSNTWNSSYTLNFYKGYNFMPSNTYSVDSIVDPGNEYTFNLPMIIHEDNDMWHTCWYLANSAGENLINFCWYYNTDSNNAGICSGIYF